MNLQHSELFGVVLITPKVFRDERGFFLESFRSSLYQELGASSPFVQDNHSYSQHGTVRGMHFQSDPGQDKLVRVATGKIYDVVVDIRSGSPTFGEWRGYYLDGESHQQLFIPKGFAHGFCVVSKEAHVLYKVSAEFNAATECGFRWNDPDIGIEWPVEHPILSARDLASPLFKELPPFL